MFCFLGSRIPTIPSFIPHITFPYHIPLAETTTTMLSALPSSRSLFPLPSHSRIIMIYCSGLFGYVELTNIRVFSEFARSPSPSSSAVPSLSSRTRISKTHAAAGNPSPSDPETSHHGPSPVPATSILFWFCYAVQSVHVVAFLFDIHLRHSTPAFPRSLIQDILY